MKDSGREPGRKDSDKPGKAGKNDRGKRDRKLRDPLGTPFLPALPGLSESLRPGSRPESFIVR